MAQNSSSIGFDDVTSLGLPSVNPVATNPLVAMSNPDQTTNTGFISTIEDYGSGFIHGAEDLFSGTVSAAESAVKSTYSAVKSVASDVTTGVENVVGFGTGQIAMILIVGGLALYLVFKSGNLKVNL